MHCLGKSFVKSGDRNDDPGHIALDRFGRHAVQWTARNDLMKRGPGEGKDRIALAHHLEIVKAPGLLAFESAFEAGEYHMHFSFDDSVVADIGCAKHQAWHTV